MNTIQKLRAKGHRITSQRLEILKQIKNHPQTAEEIHTSLQNIGFTVDLTSVYRALQLFSVEEILYEVDFEDGKKRYEIQKANNHHHHTICNNCGRVEDVELESEKKLLQEIKSTSNFQIYRHSLEFFGLCSQCF